MMNLNAIVSPAVSAINPSVTATIKPSTGYTTNAAGKRVPAYGTPQTIKVSRQALQYNDIAMSDGMNVQGVRAKFYIAGDWNGIIRADQKGGDIITLDDGSEWLVAVQAEQWGGAKGWTAVICTRQDQ